MIWARLLASMTALPAGPPGQEVFVAAKHKGEEANGPGRNAILLLLRHRGLFLVSQCRRTPPRQHSPQNSSPCDGHRTANRVPAATPSRALPGRTTGRETARRRRNAVTPSLSRGIPRRVTCLRLKVSALYFCSCLNGTRRAERSCARDLPPSRNQKPTRWFRNTICALIVFQLNRARIRVEHARERGGRRHSALCQPVERVHGNPQAQV